MACGKPPRPGSMTRPTHLRHPTVTPYVAILQDVEAIVRYNAPSERIDDAIRRGELAVERANAFGLFLRPPEHVRKQLEDKLAAIKREARHRLLDNVPVPAKPLRDGQKSMTAEQVVDWFSAAAAKRNAPTVVRALESPNHWLSKRYENRLLTLVEGRDAVPDGHRERLGADLATILRRFPDAAGLVKRLTVQDQRRSTEPRPVRNAHSAIGSAYELIATASLIRTGSSPVNAGAPMLHTSGLPYTYDITFGSRSNTVRMQGRDGTTPEGKSRSIPDSDLRITRKGLLTGLTVSEIGVSFAHTWDAGKRHAPDAAARSVDGAVKAIREREVHEYHFVTNGTFDATFKAAIDQANEKLVHEGRCQIGYHEHFARLPADRRPSEQEVIG
jgi:hypothetical protein